MCLLVSAVLARGVSVVIPLFFVGQLFFRRLAAMDILTIGAVQRLRRDGFLLAEDAERLLREARERDIGI